MEGAKAPRKMSRGLYVRNWLGLLVLGTLNNFFYVLVNSAGQRLCRSFHQENWIGAVLWCNISFGLIARLANMLLLEGTSFKWRMGSVGVGTLLGLAGIVTSLLAGERFFWLCLLSIIFVGTSNSFGESVALCYLKKFPSELVGAWSSGTGWAGVLGTVVYTVFVLPGIDLPDKIIFAAVAPLVIVYLLMFFVVIRPLPESAIPSETTPLVSDPESEQAPAVVNVSSQDKAPVPEQAASLPAMATAEAGVSPLPGGKKKFARCFKKVWWLALNLILVYFFEYVACTGGSDRAQGGDWKHNPNWFIRESYVVLNVCYQVGVLISRSSLSIVKIRRVEVLTVLQGLNLVFWLLQCTFHWVEGYPIIWLLFAHMVFVGLLGGASYVNIFFTVLNKPDIDPTDRELSVNIVALSNTFGITMASIAIIILDHFLWVTPASSFSSSSYLSAW